MVMELDFPKTEQNPWQLPAMDMKKFCYFIIRGLRFSKFITQESILFFFGISNPFLTLFIYYVTIRLKTQKEKFDLKKRNAYRKATLALLFMNKIDDDHVSAYAAMSAYFMIMSIVPFLMLVLFLAKYLPFSTNDVLTLLNNISIVQENAFLQSIINEIFLHTNTTVMGLTIVAMIWAASKGIWAIIQGLNTVYDIEESRNILILRILAMFYTVAFILIIAISLVLLVFSSSIFTYVLNHHPQLEPIAEVMKYSKGFFSLFILTGFFLLLYKYIPDRKTTFKSEICGAIFASVGWSLFSYGFSIYVSRFSNYTHIYGGLGTVLLFLLWFYMIMYILFLGAELNCLLSYEERQKMWSNHF